MSENRFSGWAVVLIVVLVLGVAIGSLASGLFLGYQWGRSAGRSQLPNVQFQRLAPPVEPEIPRHDVPRQDIRPFGQPFLGVAFQSITPDLAEAEDLAVDQGALITEVVPESPADDADLRRGDIITAVDGRPVDDDHPLAELILRYAPGDEVELEVLRGRREFSVDVVLGSRLDEGFLDEEFMGRFGFDREQMFEFLDQEFPGLHFQFQCGEEPCFHFEDEG
jgi:membrane-associated protease RseP (regulator of RpoE activity)